MEWNDQEILSQKGSINCDSPNEYLEAWEGKLTIGDYQFACKYNRINWAQELTFN